MQHINISYLNDKQKGFIASARYLRAANVMHGDFFLGMFSDMFPLPDIFSKEFCKLPAIYTRVTQLS